MKSLGIGLLLIAFCFSPVGLSAAPHKATLTIETRAGIGGNSKHGRSVSIQFVEGQDHKIYCSAGSIPLHGIEVPGFDKLKAPFKAGQVTAPCKKRALWSVDGTRLKPVQTCYVAEENPLTEKIVERCLSL
jgi:hypothetical protein